MLMVLVVLVPVLVPVLLPVMLPVLVVVLLLRAEGQPAHPRRSSWPPRRTLLGT